MEGKAENMGDFIEERYKSKDEIRDYFCEENTMIMTITQKISTIKRTL